MKKLLMYLVVISITYGVYAQSPQKMSYQAVIRNSSGTLVTNHAVGLKISILQGSASGTVVFAETYSPVPQTNSNGLVTIEIGSGTAIFGSFSAINWTTGPYFLKTETDPAGGTSYTIVGTSQLLSVPYALHANTVETGDNWGSQTAITDATLTGKGTVAIPLKIAQQSATSGQALKWNGTAWSPADDATGGGGLALPFSGTSSNNDYAFSITNSLYSAIKGITTSPYSGTTAVYGRAESPYGIGIYGESTAGSGATYGVSGKVTSTNGRAILGHATSASGSTIGIYGIVESDEGTAIYGDARSSTGITYGGKFLSESSSGYGVYGESPKYGIYGISSGTKGRALMGEATSTASIGVYGIALEESSTGVWGEGTNQGVYGTSALSTGKGIYGTATSTTGINYGIYGESNSSSGYSGYFIGGKFYISGNVGIGISTPAALLHAQGTGTGEGNVVFIGEEKETGPGNPPVSGEGTRMMWYPDKAAFRAGHATGIQWDKAYIGQYSTALGISTIASEYASTALGYFTYASGRLSTAMGYSTKAAAYVSTAIGRYNVGGGDADTWVATDPLFEIGNGSSDEVHNNALTVLKNGNVGIGTTTPGYRFQVGVAGDGTQARANAWNLLSDARLKKDFTGLKDPLDMVERINGYYFYWNTGIDNTRQVGFSAQEVIKVIPEVVSKGEDGYLSIEYGKMTPLLIEAIKELKSENELLRTRLEKIEAMIGNLKN